jgi:hypothetical protein
MQSMRATMVKDPSFKIPVCPGDTLRISHAYSGGDDRLVVKMMLEVSSDECDDGTQMVMWRRVGWLDSLAADKLRDCQVSSVTAITAGSGFELPLSIVYEASPNAQGGGLVQQSLM